VPTDNTVKLLAIKEKLELLIGGINEKISGIVSELGQISKILQGLHLTKCNWSVALARMSSQELDLRKYTELVAEKINEMKQFLDLAAQIINHYSSQLTQASSIISNFSEQLTAYQERVQQLTSKLQDLNCGQSLSKNCQPSQAQLVSPSELFASLENLSEILLHTINVLKKRFASFNLRLRFDLLKEQVVNQKLNILD
jgi:chromosome segregation ATPase